MGHLLFVALYSLAFAIPITVLAGAFYLILAIFCLHFLGLSEVRGGLCGFVAINLVVFLTLFTFLVSFAYLCRSI